MVAESSNMESDQVEDLTGVMWNDRIWLSCFPLNDSTVMDYFALSQFYDRRCNNEILKMQRLDPTLLKTMAGIEYNLTSTPAPGLFIITKSKRTLTPPKLEPLATYYVHEGNVYQAPSIHAVLSSRVLQSLHHLRSAFETMQNAVVLSGQGRYVWEPPPIPTEGRGEEANEGGEAVTGAERRAVDRMLYDILEKNRRIAAEHEEKHNPQAHQGADGAEPSPNTAAANPAQ